MVTVSDVQRVLAERFQVYGDVIIHPETLVVDVHGGIKMKVRSPEFGVQFGEVYGDFICITNGLKTLKGAPHRVGRDFRCDNNLLQSLEYAPQHVSGNFICNQNGELSNLIHAPKYVGMDFICAECKLTSLMGSPMDIKGNFNCSFNHLTTLAHAPQTVLSWFECMGNPLKNMLGAPLNMGSIQISYQPQLPLLRCLNAQLDIVLYDDYQTVPKEVQDILLRYLGSDRKGMLKCAAELLKAGYKENARW